MKLPSWQFYPGDWRKDPGVQALSYEERGIWFEILLLMYESEERGKLLLNGKAMSMDRIARLLGLDEDKINRMINTLLELGVASTYPKTGIIHNRRMVRDEEIRRKKSRAGHIGGGNPMFKKGKSNPYYDKQRDKQEDKQKIESSSSSSSSSSISFKKKIKIRVAPPLEAVELAQLLSDEIFKNIPNHTPPSEASLLAWAWEAEKINRIDGHSWGEIRELLLWAQADSFWRANILSMSKFRKQWNQLLARKAQGGQRVYQDKVDLAQEAMRRRTNEMLKRGL